MCASVNAIISVWYNGSVFMRILLFVSSAVTNRVSERTVDGCCVYATKDKLPACIDDAINPVSADHIILTVHKDDIRPTVEAQHGAGGQGEE